MNLIDYVKPQGAQAALAKAIKVAPVLISQWANGKRKVPLDRCVDIEKATCGQVTCEEMRPDKLDYWAYLRKSEVVPCIKEHLQLPPSPSANSASPSNQESACAPR